MFQYILKYTKMFVHKWLVVTCLWEIANGLKLNTHPHTRGSVWWLRTWPFLCETFNLVSYILRMWKKKFISLPAGIGRVTQGGGGHLTAPSVEIILICATYSGVLLLIFNFFLDLFQVIISVYQHSYSMVNIRNFLCL